MQFPRLAGVGPGCQQAAWRRCDCAAPAPLLPACSVVIQLPPEAPLKVLQWLGQEDAPLLFRLRADMRQWLWGLSFLRNCTPERTRHNIRQIVSLGTYSRSALQQLRRDTGIQYDQRMQGILHFYTTAKEFDGALAPAEQMRQLGCERRVISADEAVRIEPALAHIRPQLAGATYTAEDESGDANLFVRELARLCEQAGVRFRMGAHIPALRTAYPELYAELQGEPEYVELVQTQWLRTHFLLEKADAFPELGIHDLEIRANLHAPDNQAEIEMFIGRPLQAGPCLP